MIGTLRKPPYTALAAFVLAFLIAFSRRGTNLLRPQIWDEDGTMMLPHFLAHGWSSFKGDEGYLMLVPHLVTNLAGTIAPHAYTTVSTWLAWLFMAGVAAYIAAAPSLLKGRFFLALACFLVPTDPEVFGVPLYTFWWAGVLLLLLPFWEKAPSFPVLRAVTLVVCGLSSPIAAVAAPAMAVRAAFLRNRTEIALAIVAVLCAGAQLYVIANAPYVTVRPEITGQAVVMMLEKFVGWFAVETTQPASGSTLLISGVVVSIVMAAVAWRLPNRWVALGLLFLFAGTVASSVSRVSVALLDILYGGPRYFFYPFILLSWLLVQGLYVRSFVVGRVLCAAILGGALINATASGWSRDHDDIPLARHLASCLHFDVYSLPIQLDGRLGYAWHYDYPRTYCERLGGDPDYDRESLYPFSVRARDEAISRKDPLDHLELTVLSAAIPQSVPEGFSMTGTFGIPGGGDLEVSVARGARILFASSADAKKQTYTIKSGDLTLHGELPLCPDLCSLDFSSDILPEKFAVLFSDAGDEPQDWFAVGSP